MILGYGSGGRAAVVTPLASLYALVTIPLAVIFRDDRVTFREGPGLVLALPAGVALSCGTKPGPI